MHVATRDERGFSMVELLVVILIVGILATIALPAFNGQRIKGQDTEAQQMVRTVATALATYETDAGTYDASRADLERIEPAIGEASDALAIEGEADGYTITERSASDTEFTLVLAPDGRRTRSCSVAERGLCRAGNTW